jgi:phospho-N-acetylmuramoyl-pentapeptide-transferase
VRALGLQTFHWRKTEIDNSLFYELHQKKIGTPSMGGVLMVVVTSALVPFVVHASWTGVFLLCFVLFALLGLADDVSKLLVKAGRRRRELSARPKFVAQWALALLVGVLLYGVLHIHTISLPGGCDGCLDLSWGYIAVAAFVLVSTTNAVNITDGLDGLAGGLLALALSALIVVDLWQGRYGVAQLAALVLGPVVAFLFYNVHPAKVIMGDIGALALGAALGMVALLGDNLVGLILVSGVFIVEALSSALQLTARRVWGRRIFRIAPLHHHLEALGWPETRITAVFWTAGLLCASLAVMVGKIGG